MECGNIAKQLKYEIAGDKAYNVIGIDKAKYADVKQIAVCYRKEEVEETNAKVVLTDICLIDTTKTIIYVHDSLDYAMLRVMDILRKEGEYKDYSREYSLKVNEKNIAYGENVKIGVDTIIEPFTKIESGVKIGKSCVIESNVQIKKGTTIEDNVTIKSGSVVGADSFFHYFDEENNVCRVNGVGGTIIKSGTSIGYNCVIQRGFFRDTIIDKDTQIGNLIDIGHDVRIGKECRIVSQTGIAGEVVIGDYVQIYGQVGVADRVEIGEHAKILGKSSVTKDIKAGETVSGMYAREHVKELRTWAKIRKMF